MSQERIDHSLAIACIGYEAPRALRERGIGHTSSAGHAFSASPIPLILEEDDPVGFCIDAMRIDHPDWVAELSKASRSYIRDRLIQEARRAGISVAH
jgi:hypothetical protein